MNEPITIRRWRNRLPHWEVDRQAHFITIRCHGSLPKSVQLKVLEIRKTLETIPAQSPEFSQLQRQYFLTCEKYLDKGEGFAPFKDAGICDACLKAQAAMEQEGWQLIQSVLMPNHIHIMIRRRESAYNLQMILKRFKGRSARWGNQQLQRTGHFWQEDWFDRWIRNETEYQKTQHYIRHNPVKAGLVSHVEDYPWLKP